MNVGSRYIATVISLILLFNLYAAHLDLPVRAHSSPARRPPELPCGNLSRRGHAGHRLAEAEHEAVSGVAQLAHVARPVVRHQRAHQRAVELGDVAAVAAARLAGQAIEQQGHVLAALAQGRVGERDHGQPVRSEERRVGKEGASKWRSRWSPYHEKKKNN